MTCTYEDYQKILQISNCAKWYHTNLHMHTPATAYDWNAANGINGDKAGNITFDDYFTRLIQTSLDLVAITDHNTVEWCEPLMKLAGKARKKGETNIHILPGVEITSYEGPHIIGIFDEDTSLVPKIKNMLIRLGLSGEGREDDVVGKGIPNRKPTLIDIIEEIDGIGGVVIAPHINSRGKGIWGNQDFSGRYEVINHKALNILAAPSGSIKIIDDEEKHRRLLYKTMNCENIQRSFAFINVSDCHRLDDFEKDTTWIKMSEPTVNGIRQIIFEPETRVSTGIFCDKESKFQYKNFLTFENPQKETHPYIIGIVVNGGYFNEQIIPFSPNQNCIIGKNYSGKSTIVDLLRFAFDNVPELKDKDGRNNGKYELYLDRLWGLLTENGNITVYVKGKDQEIYAINRTLFAKKSRTGEPQSLEGMPIVYKLIGEDFFKVTDEAMKNIFTVEAYPQGEVVNIKDDASKQIRIVDNIGDLSSKIINLIDSEDSEEGSIYKRLIKNGSEINELQTNIDNLRLKIENKEGVKSEITRLQNIIESSKHDELSKWDSYQTKTNQAKTHLGELIEALKHIQEEQTIIQNQTALNEDGKKISISEIKEVLETGLVDFDIISFIETVLKITDESIKQQIKNLINEINHSSNLIEKIEIYRSKKYKEIFDDISKATGDEEPQQKEVLTGRLQGYIKQFTQIQSTEEEIVGKTKQLKNLIENRKGLLKEFKDLKDEITNTRIEIVTNINKYASENVVAELLIDDDKRYFENILDHVFTKITSGSEYKLQSKNQQLDKITKSISPEEFVKLIRESNLTGLINATNVTENTAKIALMIPEKDIQIIEATYISDNLAIKFRKEGETDFTNINSGLSGGEQALALISVAMIPKGMPLIVDQPEDELGPSLITHELVEQVRKVKTSRQLIFVTHIPNIPVLGDSEQIISIKQNITESGKFGEIEHLGSLDNNNIVEKLLELDGGEDAFKQRHVRYACVMK
jgi:predicted ATPase